MQLKVVGGSKGFGDFNDKLKEQIADTIKATPIYEKYLQDSLQSFEIDQDLLNHQSITKETIYDHQNDNKFFISLDLKSANFNALRYYDKGLVLNCNNWDEFIAKFTDLKYYLKNKLFRQKIFWLLEPDKQRKIIGNFLGDT